MQKQPFQHGTFGRSVSMLIREMRIGESVEFRVVNPVDDKIPNESTCRATISEAAKREGLTIATSRGPNGEMYVTKLDPSCEGPTAVAVSIPGFFMPPPPRKAHYARYGYGRLQVGEALEIEVEGEEKDKFISRVHGYGFNKGRKFTCRTTDKGVTVWRIM